MTVTSGKAYFTPDIDYSLFGGAEIAPKPTVTSPESKEKSYTTKACTLEKRSPRRTTILDNLKDKSFQMSDPQDPTDFLWLMTEEPHRSRRLQIMKAHPEVTKLMGHEPLTKYVVFMVITIQLGLAFWLRHYHPLSLRFLLTAYVIGGTANHNLFLAIHEITHNLAFRGIIPNKILAMIANLPIGIPYAVTFKGYHLEHHKQLGEDGVDTDLPTRLELLLLNNVFGKVFFCTFQILFYALRPGLVRSQRLNHWHFINIAVQLLFDSAIYTFFGLRPLIYFFMSSFFAGSLHPLAGHFIAEHYLWDGLEQETYSYYGPLNILAYNVGYHNEHHDFPSIPWTRLPLLHELAPEFYKSLASHPSWPMLIVNFIRDKEVGIFARAKRLSKDKMARMTSGKTTNNNHH